MWFGACHRWFGSGAGWGWMAGGGVMMLVLWAGLLLLAVFAVRAWQGHVARPAAGVGLDLLKARYARGEINKAEYEEIRRDIER